MEQTLATRIESILHAERTALLAGSFEALEKIAPMKAAIIPHLLRGGLDKKHLSRLRHVAARNEALLAASAEGIRAAVRRVSDIRDALEPLNTYSPDGARQGLTQKSGKVERRA